MKTYYIYHIPGTKIGCTSDLEKRMRDQGFTDWEILEEHTDIYLASEREVELQKQYGYTRDNPALYYQSVNRRLKGSYNSGYKIPALSEFNSKTKRKLTMKDALDIRAKYKPFYYTKKMLALEYGVAHQTIDKILNGSTYK